MPDSRRVVDLIKAVGADGANGDTMNGMAEEWWAEAERIDYPVALQPELGFGELNWLGNITCVFVERCVFCYSSRAARCAERSKNV